MKIVEDEKRDVIPRWRTFVKSINETEAFKPIEGWKEKDHVISQELLDEWNQNPTLTLATEIVSSGYVTGSNQTAIEAAKMVASSHTVSRLAKELAGFILGQKQTLNPETTFEEGELIRNSRLRTKLYPRNAIAWVDLALGYVIAGKTNEARKSLRVALNLAPDDRFVLRAVSRFLVHQNEEDVALHILRSRLITKHDPWLMATEIALCEAMEISSPLTKAGRRIILKGEFSPFNMAELSSEIATIEYRHGDIRNASKLFRKSLENPTENAIAQAGWVARRDKSFSFDGSMPNTDLCSAEAMAWGKYLEGDWNKSAECSLQWFQDQPFSVRPALLGSSVYSMALEDYSTAIDMCEKSIRCNPDDEMLLNNFAYILAMNNETERAKRYFDRIPGVIENKKSSEAVVFLATRGLLRIRSGQIQEGIADYNKSIQMAAKNKDPNRMLVASANLATELRRMGQDVDAKQVLTAASSIADASNDPLASFVFSQAKKRIAGVRLINPLSIRTNDR